MEYEKMSVFEFLQYSTVKIQCKGKDGELSFGTGFFFNYQFHNEKEVPVIVTNKHVVEGAIIGSFKITTLDKEGRPNHNDIVTIGIQGFEQFWIFHPQAGIDLCIFPFGLVSNNMRIKNQKPSFAPFRETEIPNFINVEDYKPTEEIYMVGYPNGLGDDLHNRPLIRKGITATPFFIDHNGEPNFMVDCACFPGSSGSPILIVDQSSYSLHNKPLQAGNRMLLLGILYAGPQYNAKGEIVKYKVPTSEMIETNIPMNLGYCISSKKIMDFKPLIENTWMKNR